MSSPAGNDDQPPSPALGSGGLEGPPTLAQLERLLDELNEKMNKIRQSWGSGELDRLRILAGQLSTAAKGSGNRLMTESATELESVLLAEESETSAVCEKVEALIQDCKRAAGG